MAAAWQSLSKESQQRLHFKVQAKMHANILVFCGRESSGESSRSSGGDDTSEVDRKTGRRRWEMERKGGEREQERAPVPSLNLSCSDQ